jgi:peptide/nickel transport system substrate-binding protein
VASAKRLAEEESMRTRVLAILTAAALVVTACQPSAAPSGAASVPAVSPSASAGGSASDTLQMHWLGDLTAIWHPASQETFSQAVNFQLMFDKLIERKWDKDTWTPAPDLADSWDISADGLKWTFHLHPGIKWHDGEPFTAKDVAFTISRALLNTRKNPQNAWSAVVGVDKVTSPTETASGVKVIDDNTIELTINAPNADFFSDLTDPSAFIVPEHVLKNTDPKAVETIEFSTTKPIGTGPYKFVKYETDQYSQFEANPDYFQGPPKIKNIFVKRLLGDQAIAQLESGDLDLSIRLNPAEKGRLEKAPKLDVLSTSGVGTYGPYMNLLTLKDVKTRKAIAIGVDAQGIIDSIYKGAGHINRGVLPGMPAADDQEFFDYDPVKAKQLLDGSSWDKAKPLRIVFDKSFAGVEQWTPIMQQNLEAIGFKVELIGLDTTAAIEMYDKIDQFDVTIAQGGDQGVGPFRSQIYFSCKQVEPAHFKTYSRNCAIDDAFVAARKEIDPAKRTTIFKGISKLINQEVEKVSWWTTNALSAKVKGLDGVTIPPDTREFIVGVQNWTLTK